MPQLYRPPSTAPKTVLFAGTGIIEGSWLPVRNALVKHIRHLPEGEENLAFATEVYRMRTVAAAYQGGLKLVKYNLKERRSIKRAFASFYDGYNRIKREIADQLIKATADGQLKVRPVVDRINTRWLKDTESKVVVTTNWDLMLERYFDDCQVYHLHGDVTDYATLYLPSEHSREPYHLINSKVGDTYLMGKITHGNWLATQVETLIIAGLSLSPLDAEINTFLRCACDSGRRTIRHVIIVDPLPEVVLPRLKFHCCDAIGEITLLKPEEV